MSTPRDHRVHAPALAAGLGSALLSAAVLLRRPLVNNDGVYYLLAAEAWARGGLEAARAVYLWPFFSGLVAGVAGLLGTSAETAAHLLCASLLALTSGAFVAVVARLGGGRREQWLAAALVLAHPWLNEARGQIVRDFGAWALGLLALAALLRFEHSRPADLARWAALGSAAVLFRPDAAALLLAAPLALLLRRDAAGRRRIPVAVGALAFAVAVAAALAWVLTHPVVEVSAGHFRRASAALAASFPLPYGREYAPLLLATGLAVLPVVKTLKALGLLHALLAALGGWRARPPNAFHRAALAATLAAAALPLFVQAARLLFVESRYTIFATLVLALLAPFGAAWLLDRAPRRATVALAVLLAATLFSSLPRDDRSGAHVRAAAAWVRDHGGGARLHTNSLQVAYLSGAPVDWPLVHLAATVNGAVDGALFQRRRPVGGPARRGGRRAAPPAGDDGVVHAPGRLRRARGGRGTDLRLHRLHRLQGGRARRIAGEQAPQAGEHGGAVALLRVRLDGADGVHHRRRRGGHADGAHGIAVAAGWRPPRPRSSAPRTASPRGAGP